MLIIILPVLNMYMEISIAWINIVVKMEGYSMTEMKY